ncbi:MAG: hypothetical protein J7M05_03920 [Anaerolineae bacterium]|nr:hypothetical protein [Anaerolineae bacterium]
MATPLPSSTLAPQEVLAPSPTPTFPLIPLKVAQSSVQHWSDVNDIVDLLYDGEFLWAATSGGVVRWSLEGEHLLYTQAEGLVSLAVKGLALDGERHLWVAYADRQEWSEFDGQRWHTWSSPREAVEARYKALLQAQKMNPRLWSHRPGGSWVWLAREGHVEAYDGQRWRVYAEYEGVRRHTWMVLLSASGQVWTVGAGLSTAEEGDRWWEDHNFFAEIGHWSQVRDAAVDPDGGLWLAFMGPPGRDGGVCWLSPGADHWEGYLHALNQAIPRQVYRVSVGDDGTIWLGGEGALAFRRPGHPWKRLSLSGLDVNAFAWAKGKLWLGTSEGIWSLKVDQEELEGPWLAPSPLLGRQVVSLLEGPEGHLYVGTNKGLSWVDPTRGEARVLLSVPVRQLALGKSGKLWIGTPQGLWSFALDVVEHNFSEGVLALTSDAQGVLWFISEEGKLFSQEGQVIRQQADLTKQCGAFPRDLAVDGEGTVWMATEEGLLSFSREGEFHLETREGGLLSNDVRALALGPEGELWIATARGLVRRLPSGRWTRYTTESTGGGLRSMEMWDVFVDDRGKLWMATSKGVSCRTPEADWAYWDVPEAHCVLVDHMGAVWIGTLQGLYRLDPQELSWIPD